MSSKPYTGLSQVLSDTLIKEAMDKVSFDMPSMEQVSPGLWRISSGGKNPIIIYTGDGGAENFRQALREAAKEFNNEVL